MIGDLRALDDLVVGQHDVAVGQRIRARLVQDLLDTGAEGLHPPQLLARLDEFWRDVADVGIRIADFAHGGL